MSLQVDKVVPGNIVNHTHPSSDLSDLTALDALYQPLDADLTALAALATTGMMARTAANTYALRTITGTTNRITITNGNGVSGNPTINIASNYVGQNTITTLGVIGTGEWQGTRIEYPYGGTGISDLTGYNDHILGVAGDAGGYEFKNITSGDSTLSISHALEEIDFAVSDPLRLNQIGAGMTPINSSLAAKTTSFAGTGTVSITGGAQAITFSTNVTLKKGDILLIGGERPHPLKNDVTNSTSGDAQWKFEGSGSGLSYTVVRPAFISYDTSSNPLMYVADQTAVWVKRLVIGDVATTPQTNYQTIVIEPDAYLTWAANGLTGGVSLAIRYNNSTSRLDFGAGFDLGNQAITSLFSLGFYSNARINSSNTTANSPFEFNNNAGGSGDFNWYGGSTTIQTKLQSSANGGRIHTIAGTQTTNYAKAGGSLFSSTTTQGNTTTSETDLFSNTLKGNTLSSNGDSLDIDIAGTYAATINDKQLRVKLGSTTLFDSDALTIITAYGWRITGKIIRVDATSQKCVFTLTTQDTSVPAITQYIKASENLANDLTLKVTGQATATNDIVGEMWRVEWRPTA